MKTKNKSKLAKVTIGTHSRVVEYKEPKELEEIQIDLKTILLTLVKDRGELIITSAINTLGREVIEDLMPYKLTIERL